MARMRPLIGPQRRSATLLALGLFLIAAAHTPAIAQASGELDPDPAFPTLKKPPTPPSMWPRLQQLPAAVKPISGPVGSTPVPKLVGKVAACTPKAIDLAGGLATGVAAYAFSEGSLYAIDQMDYLDSYYEGFKSYADDPKLENQAEVMTADDISPYAKFSEFDPLKPYETIGDPPAIDWAELPGVEGPGLATDPQPPELEWMIDPPPLEEVSFPAPQSPLFPTPQSPKEWDLWMTSGLSEPPRMPTWDDLGPSADDYYDKVEKKTTYYFEDGTTREYYWDEPDPNDPDYDPNDPDYDPNNHPDTFHKIVMTYPGGTVVEYEYPAGGEDEQNYTKVTVNNPGNSKVTYAKDTNDNWTKQTTPAEPGDSGPETEEGEAAPKGLPTKTTTSVDKDGNKVTTTDEDIDGDGEYEKFTVEVVDPVTGKTIQKTVTEPVDGGLKTTTTNEAGKKTETLIDTDGDGIPDSFTKVTENDQGLTIEITKTNPATGAQSTATWHEGKDGSKSKTVTAKEGNEVYVEKTEVHAKDPSKPLSEQKAKTDTIYDRKTGTEKATTSYADGSKETTVKEDTDGDGKFNEEYSEKYDKDGKKTRWAFKSIDEQIIWSSANGVIDITVTNNATGTSRTISIEYDTVPGTVFQPPGGGDGPNIKKMTVVSSELVDGALVAAAAVYSYDNGKLVGVETYKPQQFQSVPGVSTKIYEQLKEQYGFTEAMANAFLWALSMGLIDLDSLVEGGLYEEKLVEIVGQSYQFTQEVLTSKYTYAEDGTIYGTFYKNVIKEGATVEAVEVGSVIIATADGKPTMISFYNTEKTLVKEVKYDPEGQPTYIAEYKSDGKLVVTYEYAAGEVTKVTYFKDDVASKIYEFEGGQIAKITDFSDESYYDAAVYEFTQGMIAKIEIYKQSDLVSLYEFTGGELAKVTNFIETNKVSVFSYAGGEPTEALWYSEKGQVLVHTEFSAGKITKITNFAEGDQSGIPISVFEYQGGEIQTIASYDEGKLQATYDYAGAKLIELTEYAGDEKVAKVTALTYNAKDQIKDLNVAEFDAEGKIEKQTTTKYAAGCRAVQKQILENDQATGITTATNLSKPAGMPYWKEGQTTVNKETDLVSETEMQGADSPFAKDPATVEQWGEMSYFVPNPEPQQPEIKYIKTDYQKPAADLFLNWGWVKPHKYTTWGYRKQLMYVEKDGKCLFIYDYDVNGDGQWEKDKQEIYEDPTCDGTDDDKKPPEPDDPKEKPEGGNKPSECYSPPVIDLNCNGKKDEDETVCYSKEWWNGSKWVDGYKCYYAGAKDPEMMSDEEFKAAYSNLAGCGVVFSAGKKYLSCFNPNADYFDPNKYYDWITLDW